MLYEIQKLNKQTFNLEVFYVLTDWYHSQIYMEYKQSKTKIPFYTWFLGHINEFKPFCLCQCIFPKMYYFQCKICLYNIYSDSLHTDITPTDSYYRILSASLKEQTCFKRQNCTKCYNNVLLSIKNKQYFKESMCPDVHMNIVNKVYNCVFF